MKVGFHPLRKYKNSSVAVRAALWFVLCNILQKGVSLLTVPIFTRVMSTESYGLFSVYTSLEAIVIVFSTLNLQNCAYPNALTKFKDEKDKDELAVSLMSLSTVSTVFMLVLCLGFQNIIFDSFGLSFEMMALMLLYTFFSLPISLWTVKQRFIYKYKSLVAVTFSVTFLSTFSGLGLVLLWEAHQTLGRILGFVIVEMIFGIVIMIYYIRRAKKLFSMKYWKWALKLHLPLIPHSLSLNILISSDRLMIGAMVNSVSAAIYSVAYTAGSFVNIIKQSIVEAMRPWVYQKLKEKKYDALTKTCNGILLMVILISLILIVFAPEVIAILAPPKYYEAIYIIPPVSCSTFFTFLYSMFSIVEFYYEKTKKIMIASVAGAAVNIVLNFIFIPLFGYIAAGYTTLVSYIFLSVMHYIFVRQLCKEKDIPRGIFDLRFIAVLSVVVVIISVLFIFLYQSIIVRYAILAVLLIVFFLKRKFFINLMNTIRR